MTSDSHSDVGREKCYTALKGNSSIYYKSLQDHAQKILDKNQKLTHVSTR